MHVLQGGDDGVGGEVKLSRLRLIIQRLQRHQFGRRSERLDGDQLALGLEDLDTDLARVEAHHPALVAETKPELLARTERSGG